MALTDSNTFVEPTAATAISTARTQFNNSLRSILTNFKSEVAPSLTSGNLTRGGAAVAPDDGTLFFLSNSEVKGALVIADSVNKKNDAIFGGNFTRSGLAIRNEAGIAALASKIQHYEIGELVTTVVDAADAALNANGRLYLKTTNSTFATSVIDVGIPPTNGSIINTMVGVGAVTGDRLNFAFNQPKGMAGVNAHLKVSAVASNPSAIALGTVNAANTSLVHLGATTTAISAAGKDGINILVQDGKTFGNVAARVISQATIQNTATDVAPLLPPGSIIMWGNDTAPTGWLLCDGSAVSRSTYAALFAILSTSFGVGDGSSTFNLPDFDDRVPGGKNSGIAGYTPSTATIANNSGQPQLTTASTTPTFSGTGQNTVALGQKDTTSTNSIITGGNVGAHTHTLAMAIQGVKFIIKT